MGHSDDDDFSEYGTGLEPIEADEVARKKPITVAEQIAVDENGRRRFHGAFTGGFSAGYFNTVGSKEGWTPSTFKSSRQDRNKFKSQNVLDFMDDEDKGVFGIAPQVLRPTDEFSDKSADSKGRKRPWSKQSDGAIPGMPVLDKILQPAKETVGIKILIKMGWRPGKGIGPKIDRKDKAKRAKKSELKDTAMDEESQVNSEVSEISTERIYGCSIPAAFRQQATESEGSSDDEDIEQASSLLAPDDVSSLLCNPKENTFGLGYKGLDRNTLTTASDPSDLFGSKLKFRVENKKMSITGEAFGVGAFEDHDDDIYSREDMSQYDFALETPEERKRRKANEDKEKRKRKNNKENCLESFKPASVGALRRKVYPPPTLPPNFEPYHQRKSSRFEGTSKSTTDTNDAQSKGLMRHTLTISERQVLIEDDINTVSEQRKQLIDISDAPTMVGSETTKVAEEKVEVVSDSVKESNEDIKLRIDRLKKFTQVLQAYSTKPEVEKGHASFKPFMKNPEKQERYEKYLTLRDAGFSECLKDLQPSDMTEWERDREKMEFERASKLYKPMNSVLSNRFVSANSHDISHLEPEKEVTAQKDPKEDPKVAARMKLFGKLTHRVVEWHPDKLVCKRFNIPHPFPDSKFVGVKGDLSTWASRASNISATAEALSIPTLKPEETTKKKSLFDNLDFSKPPPGLLPKEPTSSTGAPSDSSPVSTSNSGVSGAGAPLLSFQQEISSKSSHTEEDSGALKKAPLDLFKEIFADSSESESESMEEVSATLQTTSGTHQAKENKRHDFISGHMPRQESHVRDDEALDKLASPNNSEKAPLPENESVNQKKEISTKGVFDGIDLDRLKDRIPYRRRSRSRSPALRSTTISNDRDRKDDYSDDDSTYGPAPPQNPSSSQRSTRPHQSSSNLSSIKTGTTPTFSSFLRSSPSTFKPRTDQKKESNSEDVIWVEKSSLSEGSHSKSKSKKHSSKKSKRKSSKKEKHKSHKSKRLKSKKSKSRKHRSKSSKKDSSSSDDTDSFSDASSDSSVTINDSLDNKALLAKLKQITRSK